MSSSLSGQLLHKFAARYRSLVLGVIGASTAMNALVFGGSLYMLLIYDLILPSGSLPTLLSLFLLLVIVYGFQALFDIVRSRMLLSLATQVHRDLSPRVNRASVVGPLRERREGGDGLHLVRDLDHIYSYLSSPGPAALIDLPWVIVFLAVLSLLHIWLGVAALIGVIVMAAIAWTSSVRTKEKSRDLAGTTAQRNAYLLTELRIAEAATALGMRGRLRARNEEIDDLYRETQNGLATVVGRYGGAGKVFRMFVQSLILTVGALLVIGGEATGGIIIAASILGGRALAPVDQSIASWKSFVAARSGWARIVDAMVNTPPEPKRQVELELPSEKLSLQDIWVVPPGTEEAVVKAVGFSLDKGEVLAIIGPSGAGKTSLIKSILGIWVPARGEIRLDGALHPQWDVDRLGEALGYVPQQVEMVDGTISENISRFDPEASSVSIIDAAKKASLHETILTMPDGYETRILDNGATLSAGQRQRIGLARALYGSPFLLVLDEASSNLDHLGDEALTNAIAAHAKSGGIVIMITHRPATLGPATHVAVMNSGKLTDFGPRDEVLKRTFRQPIELDGNEGRTNADKDSGQASNEDRAA